MLAASIAASTGALVGRSGRTAESCRRLREMLVGRVDIGSYQRDIELRMRRMIHARYGDLGNGVLVVALPSARRTSPARVNLERVGTRRGERVGSVGHPVEPRSTAEHVPAAHHAVSSIIISSGCGRNPPADVLLAMPGALAAGDGTASPDGRRRGRSVQAMCAWPFAFTASVPSQQT